MLGVRIDSSFHIFLGMYLIFSIYWQVTPKRRRGTTRRDTATATSRPVEVIQRSFMAPPPFQRSLPLVAVRAL